MDLFSCRGFGNVLVEVIIGKVDKKNGSLEERDEVVDIDAGGIILFYTSGWNYFKKVWGKIRNNRGR